MTKSPLHLWLCCFAIKHDVLFIEAVRLYTGIAHIKKHVYTNYPRQDTCHVYNEIYKSVIRIFLFFYKIYHTWSFPCDNEYVSLINKTSMFVGQWCLTDNRTRYIRFPLYRGASKMNKKIRTKMCSFQLSFASDTVIEEND